MLKWRGNSGKSRFDGSGRVAFGLALVPSGYALVCIWFLCPLRWAIGGNYRGNILAFGFFADRGRAATFVQAKISLWGRTCDGQALFNTRILRFLVILWLCRSDSASSLPQPQYQFLLHGKQSCVPGLYVLTSTRTGHISTALAFLFQYTGVLSYLSVKPLFS